MNKKGISPIITVIAVVIIGLVILFVVVPWVGKGVNVASEKTSSMSESVQNTFKPSYELCLEVCTVGRSTIGNFEGACPCTYPQICLRAKDSETKGVVPLRESDTVNVYLDDVRKRVELVRPENVRVAFLTNLMSESSIAFTRMVTAEYENYLGENMLGALYTYPNEQGEGDSKTYTLYSGDFVSNGLASEADGMISVPLTSYSLGLAITGAVSAFQTYNMQNDVPGNDVSGIVAYLLLPGLRPYVSKADMPPADSGDSLEAFADALEPANIKLYLVGDMGASAYNDLVADSKATSDVKAKIRRNIVFISGVDEAGNKLGDAALNKAVLEAVMRDYNLIKANVVQPQAVSKSIVVTAEYVVASADKASTWSSFTGKTWKGRLEWWNECRHDNAVESNYIKDYCTASSEVACS